MTTYATKDAAVLAACNAYIRERNEPVDDDYEDHSSLIDAIDVVKSCASGDGDYATDLWIVSSTVSPREPYRYTAWIMVNASEDEIDARCHAEGLYHGWLPTQLCLRVKGSDHDYYTEYDKKIASLARNLSGDQRKDLRERVKIAARGGEKQLCTSSTASTARALLRKELITPDGAPTSLGFDVHRGPRVLPEGDD